MVSANNPPSIIDHKFEGKKCRTAFNTETNTAYVCLGDLLEVMGTTSGPRHVLPEIEELFGEGGKIVTPLQTPGGIQDVIFVSEPAATFIVSRGRTEASKRLNRWLFGEVLPSIRQNGGYIANQDKKSSEQILADAVLVAQRVIEQQKQLMANQDKQLETQMPKVEAFDSFMDTANTFSVDEVAKILYDKGRIETGQKRLFKYLRNKRILRKNNEPYQQFLDQGLFTLNPIPIGHGKTVMQTRATAKGVEYIFRLFEADRVRTV